MRLRNICIIGFICTSLVILKNLLAEFYLDFTSQFFYETDGSFLMRGFIIEYGLLASYYVSLLIYLFKKQYLAATIIWIIQVAMFSWYFYFINNFNMYEGDLLTNITRLSMNLKLIALSYMITGTIFVISYTKARIWLRVFGFYLIVSSIPMFAPDLMIEFHTIYVYFNIFIPAPIVINFWLEIKKLNGPIGNNDFETDVIDGELLSARD